MRRLVDLATVSGDRTRFVVVACVLALVLGIAPFATAWAGEKALCLVCQVTEGTQEPEEVVAVRTHDGVRRTFCSDPCAEQFDADPAAFLPAGFPRPVPVLTVADLDGKPVDWEAFKGKVVLLDFWATWCGPCRKSMPDLQKLHEKFASRGFTVLGVSIDKDKDLPKVRKFIGSKKLTYPMALDSATDSTWERFRVKAIPAAFLVDRDGRIVAQWTGIPADPTEIETKLASLLATD